MTPPQVPPTHTFDFTTAPARSGQGAPPIAVAVVIGILIIVIGLFAASQGAPGEFAILPIIFAVLFIIASIIAKGREERLAMEAASAEQEREERLKNEIAEAVKERMKGNIKIRCRYCGSLNDETDTKCSSCGAAL